MDQRGHVNASQAWHERKCVRWSIIETHVAAREGALTVVAKGIQVAEGKAPAEAVAAPPDAPQ